MNYLKIIILVSIAFSKLNGQIVNNEFDNWVTIDTLGEPYEDLISWYTNNENSWNGLANNPNLKIFDGNDIGVSITASYGGIDGSYSGMISQIINIENLIDITYLSKCDSISDRGACVVNLYDESEMLIYTDSIKNKEAAYSEKKIDIIPLISSPSVLIRIEFKAFGQSGPFEPYQAYSEFNLLNVNSNYTSNTTNLHNNDILVTPNPFKTKIQIEIPDKLNYNGYKIYSLSGKLIMNGITTKIQTDKLQNGIYFIEVNTKNENFVRKIIKH